MKKIIAFLFIAIIILTIILAVVFYFNKNTFYHTYLLNSGSSESENFVSIVTYHQNGNLNFIPVVINGKTYNFLLDTGAINILSKSIADELNLEPLAYSNTTDSQMQTNRIDMVKMPSIYIGDIKFSGYGAAVLNIENQFCMDFDGIIGSNIMDDFIWEFNEEKKSLTITNSLDNLKSVEYKNSIPFTVDKQGTPFINIKSARTVNQNVMVDTGYDGTLLLNQPNLVPTKVVEIIGNSTIGIHDKVIDYTNNYYCKLDSIKVGNISKNNVPTYFMQKTKPKVGISFFTGFDYIIDWNSKIILLKKNKYVNNPRTYNSYGFHWNYIENNVLITSVVKGSSASEKLQIGDQIIKINDYILKDISHQDWCNFNSKYLPDTLKVKIRREHETLEYSFSNKRYF